MGNLFCVQIEKKNIIKKTMKFYMLLNELKKKGEII